MIKRLLMTVCVCSAAIAYADMAGDYDVTGYDPYDKMDYTGSITITKDKNDVYQAKWEIKEGGKTYKYIGTGIATDDTMISFAYKSIHGPTEEGLQLYTRQDDETLSGPFVLFGKNLVGTETITAR